MKDLAFCLYDIAASKRREAWEATASIALIADWSELSQLAAARVDHCEMSNCGLRSRGFASAKAARQLVFEGMELLPEALIPIVEKRLESALTGHW